jgi:hypothetical protein
MTWPTAVEAMKTLSFVGMADTIGEGVEFVPVQD